MENFLKNILKDVRIELTDEFDRNFERKAFFDKAWEDTRSANKRGSLMLRTGKTRRSIKIREGATEVTWTSSLPYATILNEGGEIIVTAKMKRFFWYMFYQVDGARTFKRDKNSNVKDRETVKNKQLVDEAKMWKAMALQKVGAVMKVKQRQFIGDHPEVRRRVESIVNKNMEAVNQEILNNLRR